MQGFASTRAALWLMTLWTVSITYALKGAKLHLSWPWPYWPLKTLNTIRIFTIFLNTWQKTCSWCPCAWRGKAVIGITRKSCCSKTHHIACYVILKYDAKHKDVLQYLIKIITIGLFISIHLLIISYSSK